MPSAVFRRRTPGICLFCGLVATAAAAAGEIDVTALAPWQGRSVASLELAGLAPDLDSTARAGLSLTPRRKLLSVRKAVLTLRAAETDARRLRLLLARHGFPDAAVDARGEAVGDDEVAVTFAIAPGPAVTYGTVDCHGLPADLAAAVDSVRISLAAGARFDEDAVSRARDDLILALQRAGHAQPAVDLSLVRTDSATCDLRFTCRPGPLFVYRGLLVEGAPADLEPLTRRVIGLRPGAPFAPAVARDARRYLRDLDLYRQISLSSVARDSTALDLRADLAPRRMLTATASVGTFSDNPLVVGASVIHRNLLHRGRGLGIAGSYAEHLQDAEVRTWWPALIAARSRTDLRLRYEIQDEDSYRLETGEAELSTLFRPWRHSSFRLGLAISNGLFENRSADASAFESDVGLQTVIAAMWFRDTSDNPVDPLTGQRLTVQSEVSVPGFLADTPFASLRAFGSRYLHFGGARVLAVRLDAAVAVPLGDAPDVTPDRRWFAGGVSTMRGYRRHGLGPLDSSGRPIGGETRLLAGAEFRIPLAWILGAALFVDSGQVWRDRDETDLGDLAVAGGAGLLVRTPVGPVRIDVAQNVTRPPDGEPRTVVHFAIGHPF
ncbi:MAG TPA: BamA/TamA family outer membrane protein [Candidatus Krumholzibacteria bacterium]|nr:BamA/TamA family outer membrane protein [Candidatus Krumholzibacteria bacterium]HPD72444.1 BamA/TamA family outer membrane protein [Candidatus Krumholzibacteria bacterium]HRY40624.1 BamA/TamA family outer membrane protein [Candidatus Krumholzibacteria bacterium]